MKKYIITALFVLNCVALAAQQTAESTSISLGYWGQFGYQAGVKVGLQIPLKQLGESNASGGSKWLFVYPQLGWYSWAGKHNSFMANVEAGLKWKRAEKRSYSSLSLGVGYLHQLRIVGQRVDLGDGSSEAIRLTEPWILPTINYELGWALSDQLDWYTKLSGGIQLAAKRESVLAAFLEIGLRYRL